MSDYLMHLAARSLDPARAAVRPRLASRFEAAASWAPPVWPERRQEAPAPVETRTEEAAAPLRPARVSLRAHPWMESLEKVEDQPAPARSRRTRAMQEEEPGLTPEPGRREQAVRPLTLAEPPRPGAAAVVPAAAPVVQRTDPRTESVPVRPAVIPADKETPPPLSRPLTGRAEPERLLGPAERPSPSAEPRPAAPAVLVPKAVPPGRIIVEPRVTLAPPAPPAIPAPIQSAEAPAPTIQVTIGRIEVRAMPPPAQPSRPRPSAPSALSLEEYLRRRSKGGDG